MVKESFRNRTIVYQLSHDIPCKPPKFTCYLCMQVTESERWQASGCNRQIKIKKIKKTEPDIVQLFTRGQRHIQWWMNLFPAPRLPPPSSCFVVVGRCETKGKERHGWGKEGKGKVVCPSLLGLRWFDLFPVESSLLHTPHTHAGTHSKTHTHTHRTHSSRHRRFFKKVFLFCFFNSS